MILPNAIIGGTGRSGSTSLFRYLSDHPEVCASSSKETQFFIKYIDGITANALSEYSAYFPACSSQHKIRIEATPHYLQFADKIAPLIHNTLPGVKLIFILREPVSRLFTGYRNLRELENQTFGTWTFDEFVEHAISNKKAADHHAGDPRLRAASYMYTGCYSKYLATYYETFKPNQICILFFDTLASSPNIFIAQAAEFLGINERFYDSYSFTQENRYRGFRFRSIHRIAHITNLAFEPILNKHPAVRRFLRNIYNSINEVKKKQETPSDKSMSLLNNFYRPYNTDLRTLLEKYGNIDNLPDWLRP